MSACDLFKGLKVLELASVLAGPLAGSFFAELGAEVTKVENAKSGGDITRQWLLPEESDTKTEDGSAYYHSANYGKESIFLNLDNPESRSVLQFLIKESDLIISNFQKRVGEKLGLTPKDLYKLNDKAVILQLNAYSYDDPRPGFDLVMQAETGYISMTGHSDEMLAKMPVAMIDVLASHQIKEAALIGLLQKERKGEGSIWHISLYDSALSGLVNQGANYLIAGHIAKPLGTLHPNIAPYGDVFETKDGIKVMLAVGSDAQFQKLGDSLGLSIEVLTDFKRNLTRLQKRSELRYALESKIQSLSYPDFVTKMNNAVPFCKVKEIDEVLDSSEAQKMILTVRNAQGAKKRILSSVAFQREC